MATLTIFTVIIFLGFLLQMSGTTYHLKKKNSTSHRAIHTIVNSNVNADKSDSQPSSNPSNEAGYFLPYRKLPAFEGPVENKDIVIVRNDKQNNYKDTTVYNQEEGSTYSAYTAYQPPTEHTIEEYAPVEDTAYYQTREDTTKSPLQSFEPFDEETTDEPKEEVMEEFKDEMSHQFESEEISNSFLSHFDKESNNIINEEIDKLDDAIADIHEAIQISDTSKSEEIDLQIDSDTGMQDNIANNNVEQGNEELFASFAEEELKYSNFPTKPADTRRMFEHPAEPGDAKIAEISREINFRKSNGLSPGKHGTSCSQPQPQCINSKYRSFDGSCNNILNPLLGSKNSPYARFLSPAYGDFSLPRGVTNYSKEVGYESSLPSPREISESIMGEGIQEETESKQNTHMMMQWGQLVDHDIISTSRDAFDCCDPEIRNLPRCFPILVAETDPFFSKFGKTCLDFTRSDTHCDGGKEWPEQFNKQTAFLDGSVVYGCHEERALKLRGGDKREGGQLLGNSQLPKFLPSTFDVKIRSSPLDKATDFVAGDERVETQASLTSIQNLFFNEHNRIAQELFNALKEKILDAKELDEVVYQETRRLVSAEIQHITYNEFLPNILGKEGMSKHNLDHEVCEFDINADPSILNSFSTAAYRFGHSLVQSIFRGVNQPWRLGKFYGDSRFAFKENGHAYVNELQGLTEQPCQGVDLHVTDQMTQQLFCNKKTPPGGGHDLVSINIQRGRDHGIPGYNIAREKCGLASIQSMQSKPEEIAEAEWKALASVYQEVKQIDLYVGGLAETHQPGAVLGPTFSCIIGTQFKNLMDGDRYFYKHTGGQDIQPITGSMLEEVKGRSLADILCENTDIKELTGNVFVLPGQDNPKLPCKDHKKINLKRIADQLMKEL